MLDYFELYKTPVLYAEFSAACRTEYRLINFPLTLLVVLTILTLPRERILRYVDCGHDVRDSGSTPDPVGGAHSAPQTH